MGCGILTDVATSTGDDGALPAHAARATTFLRQAEERLHQLPLDMATVGVGAEQTADDVNAAGFGRPEDVEPFALLRDTGAEGTGIDVGKDPRKLYVNVQHPANPEADGTWAITCR